jgi:hypothetical protein
MPVFIMWAVPAIIVVGGGIYLISHHLALTRKWRA